MKVIVGRRHSGLKFIWKKKKVKGRKYKRTAGDVYRSKKYIQFNFMKKFILVRLNRCREGIDTGKSRVHTTHTHTHSVQQTGSTGSNSSISSVPRGRDLRG